MKCSFLNQRDVKEKRYCIGNINLPKNEKTSNTRDFKEDELMSPLHVVSDNGSSVGSLESKGENLTDDARHDKPVPPPPPMTTEKGHTM